MSAGLLICPVCAAPLELGTAAARCPAGHSFDRAREGYVNLLLARGARAAARGDTAAMLRARRAFLEAGHYLPLLEAGQPAMDRWRPRIPDAGCRMPDAVLDTGCGEGWWLRTLGERLAAAGRPHRLVGVDISREAARMTARRSPDAVVLVADATRRLPLADGAVTLLLNIFAPRNPAEFARVLAPGGLLLSVIPAPAHLAELRAAVPLLGIEPDKEAEVITRLTGGGRLRPIARVPVTFPMRLGPEELRALVAMSPSAFHLPADERAAVDALPAMTVTAACLLLAFVRD